MWFSGILFSAAAEWPSFLLTAKETKQRKLSARLYPLNTCATLAKFPETSNSWSQWKFYARFSLCSTGQKIEADPFSRRAFFLLTDSTTNQIFNYTDLPPLARTSSSVRGFSSLLAQTNICIFHISDCHFQWQSFITER